MVHKVTVKMIGMPGPKNDGMMDYCSEEGDRKRFLTGPVQLFFSFLFKKRLGRSEEYTHQMCYEFLQNMKTLQAHHNKIEIQLVGTVVS